MHPEESSQVVSDTILTDRHFLLLSDQFRLNLRNLVEQSPTASGLPLTKRDGLFWHKHQLYVPESLRPTVLQVCHDGPLAGHFGVHKTLELLSRDFWWPEMQSSCHNYVLACSVCTRNKSEQKKPWGLLQPLPVPDRPWQMLALDFVVDLPSSQGSTAILVVVDRFTKMAHFVALPGVPSAVETARVFIREIVRLHGLATDVVSDRGV